MRSFKSFVKANPNDAVPNFRSIPEVSQFLSDMKKEVASIENELSKASDVETFFTSYAKLSDKKAILSNVRVLSSRPDHLNDPKVSLQAAALSDYLSAAAHLAIAKVCLQSKNVRIDRALHSIAKQVECTSSQVFTLPGNSRSHGDEVHVLKMAGLKLTNGSQYDDYNVCIRVSGKEYDMTCGFTIPHIAGAASMHFTPVSSVHQTARIALDALSDEGVLVPSKRFSLHPTSIH